MDRDKTGNNRDVSDNYFAISTSNMLARAASVIHLHGAREHTLFSICRDECTRITISFRIASLEDVLLAQRDLVALSRAFSDEKLDTRST